MKKVVFKFLIVLLLVACGFKLFATYNKDNPSENPSNKVDSEYTVDKTGSKKNNSSDEDNLYVDSINKDDKKLKSKEENWDRNRVERDGEHRTKLSDDQIGSLSIPAISMNEPLFSGASELNLRRGGATVDYKEPLDEQTTAIAGHVGGEKHSFTNIKSLKIGDKIKVKDFKNKKTYTYKVTKTYVVNPTARNILKDDNKKERRLIIITCHNYDLDKHYYTERWIVEAHEV